MSVLDGKMTRFLKSIGIMEPEDFDLSFESITKDKFDGSFHFAIRKESPWSKKEIDVFFGALANINYAYSIDFLYTEIPSFENYSEVINYFLENREFINSSSKKDMAYALSFSNNRILIETSELNKTKFEIAFKDLLSFLNFIGYSGYDLISNYVEEESRGTTVITKEDIEFDNKENETIGEKIALENYKKEIKKQREEEINRDAFKKGDYVLTDIALIDSNSGSVEIIGKIFEVDIKDTRTGKKSAKVGVFDKNTHDSIYVRFISNESSLKPEDLKNDLKAGENISIKGRVVIDKFTKDVTLMGHFYDILDKDELRNDFSENKRVELHLHTKMSEMDGVTNIEDYCRLAKQMGHKALAITDHGVVQAFPEAQACAKKYGLKIIYGCELYMIEDYIYAALNPQNIKLKDATFVCFDLESTGLSIKYDRITEFGAVKIKGGIIVDRMDVLINPDIPIPEKIQKKTHITEEMVKDSPKIKDVLPSILEFIGDSIIISHNIQFDYNMLNQAMVDNGFGELNKPAIDTLGLSMCMFPESRGHSLKALSKRLEVQYDDESAHRADYDAEVLSQVWLALRHNLMIQNEEIEHKDIEKFDFPKQLLGQYDKFLNRSKHVTVLCKNREGLKDLYRIVSVSHTDWIGMYPYVPRSLIEKNRKNLLVGSACFNGEVFYASTNMSKKALEEAVKFYDYIEIQPLENYSILLNLGEINGDFELKRFLTDIIEAAEKANKPIVATGDVHYRDKEDKIYRDVYIQNQRVGGFDHPYMNLTRMEMQRNHIFFENPDQHYRDTFEMLDCFKWLGKDKAFEYVVMNTDKIASLCEEFDPIPPGLYPPSLDNCAEKLRDLCYTNLRNKYGDCENTTDEAKIFIKKRLDVELDGIISNGYSVVYYISHLLVKKSNDAGYIVGSRGSVGSSFAATMAGITEVNPLPPHYCCPKCKKVIFYEGKDIRSGFDLPDMKCPNCGTLMEGNGQNIPFQTFLGFKAEKVPDIDLNFPTDFQATAHLFTKELLGEDKVYRAGTISTVKFKTAYGYVKKYLENLYGQLNNVKNSKVSAIAYGCEEVKRTTGQHPGGIVVIPQDHDVLDFTPVQFPAGDTDATWKTTHFDFDAIHDTILKFDMLGHVDPQACRMMSVLSGVDSRDIPFNDKKVLSLFTTDDALNMAHKYMKPDNGAIGLPEFGTNFVRQMLRETKPQSFSDLLIISGLSHGTNVWANNQQNSVLSGKVGIRELIGCRDDIMGYLIEKGLDGHDAFVIMETVRKGKKLKEEQITLLREHDVPDYYIDWCRKIEYLFPKGHACAYVMMALRVAYYKVYYPLEYYAVYFSIRCEQFDIKAMVEGIDAIHFKLEEFAKRRSSSNPLEKLSVKEEEIEKTLESALEMAERGYKFVNIDLEKSDSVNFIVDKERKVLIPPFKVLEGLGEKGAISIVEARKERPFSSQDDLLERGKITKTNLNQLKELGVLDDLKEDDSISLFSFSF